jgi:hypothetical protein
MTPRRRAVTPHALPGGARIPVRCARGQGGWWGAPSWTVHASHSMALRSRATSPAALRRCDPPGQKAPAPRWWGCACHEGIRGAWVTPGDRVEPSDTMEHRLVLFEYRHRGIFSPVEMPVWLDRYLAMTKDAISTTYADRDYCLFTSSGAKHATEPGGARSCYPPSSSSNALASWRSAVSKPSVNQR